jgi:integrase
MSFVNEKGIRERRTTGTSNKKLAEAALGKTLCEVQEGKWFDNAKAKTKTFDEMMQIYFEKIADKESTLQRKEGALPHLKEVFSGCTLDRITPEAVDDYKQKRLADAAAHSTILNEVRLLSHAFNTVKWRRDNPVRDANRIKLKARKVERWLSFGEEKMLLPKTEGKLHGDLTDIVILDLNTGLSQEEILTLKWSQLDFFRKSLQTVRSKTLKARTIPLNNTALELLKRRSKVKSISGYVFTNGIGNKHDASKLKRAFKLAVEEAEIENFTFHCLRHTFATRLAQSGVDIYTVSKLLGHEDVSTTAKHYAHHYTESLRRGVDVLDSCHNLVTVSEKIATDNEEKKLQVAVS